MKVILLESDIKKNMIIECVNCNKKFNVNSGLIPIEGRTIQCGSCSHTWHYKAENLPSNPLVLDKIETTQVVKDDYTKDYINSDDLTNNKPSTKIKQKIDINENNIKKIEFKNVSNFFSYLLVFVISLIGLLILIDTFKSPLINIFPQLEIFLFNFFETLKDVKLFIIDLT